MRRPEVAEAGSRMPRSGRRPVRFPALTPRAWQVAVAVVAVALFGMTVSWGWVFDDPFEIVRNTSIRSLANLPEMFSQTVWAGSGVETWLYRPLTTFSFALNYAVSGLAPWSYHLVNVGLHALISVLVFRLGRLWGLAPIAAGLGALLFAVHPVHVEVVAAAHGRKDLLAAVFLLGMVLTHRDAISGRGSPVLPVLLFAAGLLSKEVAAAGLLLVVIHDILLEADLRAFLRRNRVATLYALHATTLLAWVLVRRHVTGGITVPETSALDNPLVGAAPLAALATAIVVVGIGLVHLGLPAGLSPDYSFDAIPLVRSPLDLRLIAVVVAAAVLAWTLRRRARPPMLLAVGWYGATLLPGANLLVHTGTIFGDRLLYLPSAAFCLAAGAGLARLAARDGAPSRSRALAATAGVALVLALSVQTVRYTRAWHDDLALFRWAIERVPRSTKAHHKLGEELLRAGDAESAVRSLRIALDIAPGNEFARQTLAQARLFGTGPGAGAEADSLYALGQRLRDQGDIAGAVALWTAAIGRDPAHAPSLGDLGTAMLLQGDTAGALERFSRAVAADPGLASAWFNLGAIHLAQGRNEDGARALRVFVDIGDASYPQQLQWAGQQLRRLDSR